MSTDSAEEDSPGQITRFSQQTNCCKIEEDGVGTHRQKRRKETHQPQCVDLTGILTQTTKEGDRHWKFEH